jgi:single-strand selective monofunctional uracil DNA glycosylase
MNSVSDALIMAACELRDAVSRLKFKAPVTHVYNPLDYAWAAHEMYLRKFGDSKKRVVFLGMNPGPFGMAQTGVPFGEVNVVRDWLKIDAKIAKPKLEHPKRSVLGLECNRSEVSGFRLWGLFKERFGMPEIFFDEHFVVNYCPLVFMEKSGCNRTPDKLPRHEAEKLHGACDAHLHRVIEALQPEWVIGVGDFAEKRAKGLFGESPLKIGKILHPSPASPAANRDWANLAAGQLKMLGVWK